MLTAAPMTRPEPASGDDVERVVGPDVHPPDAHAGHEEPRHEAPPAPQVRRRDDGEGGDEHGVARREALAAGGHVAAQHRVGHGRAGSITDDEPLHDRLEVDEGHDERGDGQPPPPQDQGHDGHDEAGHQVAELLERPQRRVQPAREGR